MEGENEILLCRLAIRISGIKLAVEFEFFVERHGRARKIVHLQQLPTDLVERRRNIFHPIDIIRRECQELAQHLESLPIDRKSPGSVPLLDHQIADVEESDGKCIHAAGIFRGNFEELADGFQSLLIDIKSGDTVVHLDQQRTKFTKTSLQRIEQPEVLWILPDKLAVK